MSFVVLVFWVWVGWIGLVWIDSGGGFVFWGYWFGMVWVGVRLVVFAVCCEVGVRRSSACD